jgi:hypothetical protein
VLGLRYKHRKWWVLHVRNVCVAVMACHMVTRGRTRWCVIVSEGQEPVAWPHVDDVEATHSSSASHALRWPNDVGLPLMDGIAVWLCGLRATAKRLNV